MDRQRVGGVRVGGVLRHLRSLAFLAALGSTACTVPQEEFDPDNAEAAQFRRLWAKGEIFIDFRGGDSLRQELLVAIAELEQNTPLRFHFVDGNSTPEFWVKFESTTSDKGFAPVGRSEGELARASTKTVRHELAHVIGLHHTTSRVDRDDHVTIHWSKIENFADRNFEVQPVSHLIGPYQVDSVVQYASDAHTSGRCATVSKGQNREDRCIKRGSSQYIFEPNDQYTDWNYSVMSMLYCDRRYCRNSCAPEDLCAAPQVNEHLARAYAFEASAEGLELKSQWPRNTFPLIVQCGPAATTGIVSFDPGAAPEESEETTALDASLGEEDTRPTEEVPIVLDSCQPKPQSLWGGGRLDDVIRYEMPAHQSPECASSPSVTFEGNVQVCMYAQCANATFSCPESSATATHADGTKGCCSSESFALENFDCQEELQLAVEVIGLENQFGQCQGYSMQVDL